MTSLARNVVLRAVDGAMLEVHSQRITLAKEKLLAVEAQERLDLHDEFERWMTTTHQARIAMVQNALASTVVNHAIADAQRASSDAYVIGMQLLGFYRDIMYVSEVEFCEFLVRCELLWDCEVILIGLRAKQKRACHLVRQRDLRLEQFSQSPRSMRRLAKALRDASQSPLVPIASLKSKNSPQIASTSKPEAPKHRGFAVNQKPRTHRTFSKLPPLVDPKLTLSEQVAELQRLSRLPGAVLLQEVRSRRLPPIRRTL